mgnify:CR=1 FL=1
MIKEAYCSFEVAKLLKEKGFNEKCRGGYHYEFDDNDNPIVMLEEWTAKPYNNDFVDEGFLCSAPTQQMVMAWLREVHHIAINIGWGEIFEDQYKWWSIVLNMDNGDLYDEHYNATYEEAVEATLKYVLENLI